MAKQASEAQANAPKTSGQISVPNDESSLSAGEKRKVRLYDIIEFVAKKSRTGDPVANADIRKSIDVEPSTLSEDLDHLESLGVVEKVSKRGLYRLRVRSLNDTLFIKTEYEGRRQRRKREKEAVARACIEYERHGGSLLGSRCCLISHGTSTEPLFRLLREVDPSKRPEKIITNSIPGILELLDSDIALTIVGGAVTHHKGGIQPIQPLRERSEQGDDDTSTAEWLGTEQFDTAILSCSSIAPDGGIWCNDGMEEFRSGVLATTEVQFIVLADSSKLKTMSGGKKLTNKIEWNPERTWLFVDDNRTPENQRFFDEFEKVLGKDHFIRVQIAARTEARKEDRAGGESRTPRQ